MGRSNAGFPWLALVVALLAAGCTSGSSESSPPSTVRLPDGIHTVPGTRLIGVPIPTSSWPSSDPPVDRSWTAIMTLHGRPLRVYEALADQALTLGLSPMESYAIACASPHTKTPSPGGKPPIDPKNITCGGTSTRSDNTESFSASVQVCNRCRSKVSTARVSYSAAVGSGPSAVVWRDLGPPKSSPGDLTNFPVLPGTKVLARRGLNRCDLAGTFVVLTVTGDPAEVWSKYYAELYARGRVIGAGRATFDGRHVERIAIAPSDYEATATFIEGRGLERPLIVYESCG